MSKPSSSSTSNSSWGPTLITSIAGLRGVMGLQILAAPQLTTRMMGLDLGSSASLITRQLGTREIAVGALTWSLYKKYTERRDPNARANLRQMLMWGNVLVDVGDVLMCVVAIMTIPGVEDAGMLVGASGVFAALWGYLGYRSV